MSPRAIENTENAAARTLNSQLFLHNMKLFLILETRLRTPGMRDLI